MVMQITQNDNRRDIILLSNSELRTWRRCRRQWYLAYHRCLAPRTNYAGIMASGTRMHRVLAAWYAPNHAVDFNIFTFQQEVQREDRESMLQQQTRIRGEAFGDCAEFVEDTGEQSDDERLAAYDDIVQLERIMLEGYMVWLEETGSDSEYTVIASEVPLIAPITQTAVLDVYAIGILDARLRDNISGATCFIDHKNVSSFTVANDLRRDTQMRHYTLLASLAFPEQHVQGAIFNMLKRVKRTAHAKPPYFKRAFIMHNPRNIAMYRQQLIGTALDIADTTYAITDDADDVQSRLYPSPTRDCAWDCPFTSVCSQLDDGRELEGLFRALYTHNDPLARYHETSTDVLDSFSNTSTELSE